MAQPLEAHGSLCALFCTYDCIVSVKTRLCVCVCVCVWSVYALLQKVSREWEVAAQAKMIMEMKENKETKDVRCNIKDIWHIIWITLIVIWLFYIDQCHLIFQTSFDHSAYRNNIMYLSNTDYAIKFVFVDFYIYIILCIYIQSWPKISAPLVNMIKEGCEN